MSEADLKDAAFVHQREFARQQRSLEWLRCNLSAYPRFLSYVVVVDNTVVGYISWAQKSGFRPEVVLELEQLAVLSNYQGKGLGRALIKQSLVLVEKQLSDTGSSIKHIMLTTRADNHAQKLYRSALGAEIEATIANLYSADEVLMIARNVNLRT
ncbi:GNAT family N-acetyltransferase [Alginatibacterium sediminis]|uniref:GNAT family N-acetyltransferase n=2 Tax=Alginatibacterium sediminis TaxID=2164068 RepID=A0A420E7T2_9ALTE|nr:GNAT family N-acetyltransferase [Alginatibacterium sediminis]